MKDCPNCNAEILSDANICVKCGWRPYHSKLQKVGESYHPLREQKFKYAFITSVLLTLFMIVLSISPIAIRHEWISEKTAMAVIAVCIVFCYILFIAGLSFLFKYLQNFYHPLDNIFHNLKWGTLCIIILPLFILGGAYLEIPKSAYGLLSLFFISGYVLWVFMSLLIGWSLIQVEKYDYIGGLSPLGYSLLASAIIPLFLFFVPICLSNIFYKANRYIKT
ncbi:MAG: zinc ribbon domain-containing protein [Prevotella sp.]|jgi:cation transport ATPase|nr:zinc ribbon domain-containing protein [Prevotella sp.]